MWQEDPNNRVKYVHTSCSDLLDSNFSSVKDTECVQGHAWSELIRVSKQSDPEPEQPLNWLYLRCLKSTHLSTLNFIRALADLLFFGKAASSPIKNAASLLQKERDADGLINLLRRALHVCSSGIHSELFLLRCSEYGCQTCGFYDPCAFDTYSVKSVTSSICKHACFLLHAELSL